MNITTDYLDATKNRLNLPSDYALAKALGISTAAVSKLRNGKDCLGDTTALKVAELLEVDPAIVVSAAHAERAKKPAEKAVWQSIYERLSKGVAVALVASTALIPTPNNNAQAASTGEAKPLYIMLNQRRKKKPALELAFV